jgi:hypothetical protein
MALGQSTGSKKGGDFFSAVLWGKNCGQKKRAEKKLGKKGQKKNNPFFGSFLGGRKKNQKVRKKIALLQRKLPHCKPIGKV